MEQLAKHRGTGKAELAQTSVIMEQAAFSFVTVYLTVHDHLSSWYGTEGVAQKPHRNRHFLESQMSTEGFRGRVSQVRILLGPPSVFLGLTTARCRTTTPLAR